MQKNSLSRIPFLLFSAVFPFKMDLLRSIQKSLSEDTLFHKKRGLPANFFHIDTFMRYTSPLLLFIARSLNNILGIKIMALQINQEPNAHE